MVPHLRERERSVSVCVYVFFNQETSKTDDLRRRNSNVFRKTSAKILFSKIQLFP